MTFIDLTAEGVGKNGATVSRQLVDPDVTVIEPAPDASEDVRLSIESGDTTVQIRLDDTAAVAIADRIAEIQRKPRSGFPLPADWDDSPEFAA